MRRWICTTGVAWALYGIVSVWGCATEPTNTVRAALSIELAPTNSGDQQTGTVGATLPNPLRVLVRSGATPVPGVAVYWLANRGALSAARSTTDASGIAIVTWTLDRGAGPEEVAYALSRFQAILSFDTVPHFSAIATPGPAVRLRFVANPSNAFPDRPIIPAVQVGAADAFDNPVTGLAGTIIVALGGPGAGHLSGTTSVSATCDSLGCLASFTELSVDQVGTAYVLTASASGLTAATSAAFDVVAPGAGHIAFESSRDGNAEIYVMNADGSGLTRATSDPATDFLPAWSPDGSRIAFVSTRGGGPHIYTMNPDGSGVTAMPAGLDYAPAWSHDGARLAGGSGYASRCPPRGQPCRRYDQLFVANVDGSGLIIVARGLLPTWSPDGRLAFGNGGLHVIDADGSGPNDLTSVTFDQEPAWSPDGTKIAFISNRGGPYDVFVMSSDGTGITQLTHDQATEGRPAWSPDGTRIAFESDKSGNPQIYVMNADGAELVALTDNAGFNGWPAWAP